MDNSQKLTKSLLQFAGGLWNIHQLPGMQQQGAADKKPLNLQCNPGFSYFKGNGIHGKTSTFYGHEPIAAPNFL